MNFRCDFAQDVLSCDFGAQLYARIMDNGRQQEVRDALAVLFGTVVFVVRSTQGGTPLTITLRFDYGRVIAHRGRVGRPELSFWGTAEEILDWAKKPSRLHPEVSRILPRLTAALSSTRHVFGDSDASGLKIFGHLTHPRMVYRLALLLAPS